MKSVHSDNKCNVYKLPAICHIDCTLTNRAEICTNALRFDKSDCILTNWTAIYQIANALYNRHVQISNCLVDQIQAFLKTNTRFNNVYTTYVWQSYDKLVVSVADCWLYSYSVTASNGLMT